MLLTRSQNFRNLRKSLEAGKVKETNSPLAPPEGTRLVDTLILAANNSGIQNCKIITFVFFLSHWMCGFVTIAMENQYIKELTPLCSQGGFSNLALAGFYHCCEPGTAVISANFYWVAFVILSDSTIMYFIWSEQIPGLLVCRRKSTGSQPNLDPV